MTLLTSAYSKVYKTALALDCSRSEAGYYDTGIPKRNVDKKHLGKNSRPKSIFYSIDVLYFWTQAGRREQGRNRPKIMYPEKHFLMKIRRLKNRIQILRTL